MEDCVSCAGTGTIDVGDCDEGVTVDCPACDGTGEKDYSTETFVPARDAWMPGD